VGQPYQVRLVSFRALKEPAHLALHPFGQIPTYEEGELALFETGAIVFHIAEQHAGLLPGDANARARAITWMFAALSTVEPPILELVTAKLLEADKPWRAERLPLVDDRIRARLKQLSARLGDADWLDGAFSAGDLLMVSVLLRLRLSGIVNEFPNLAAYLARGEARPAYQRAFAAHWRSTPATHRPADRDIRPSARTFGSTRWALSARQLHVRGRGPGLRAHRPGAHQREAKDRLDPRPRSARAAAASSSERRDTLRLHFSTQEPIEHVEQDVVRFQWCGRALESMPRRCLDSSCSSGARRTSPVKVSTGPLREGWVPLGLMSISGSSLV
jgi:glutathione S-transferase